MTTGFLLEFNYLSRFKYLLIFTSLLFNNVVYTQYESLFEISTPDSISEPQNIKELQTLVKTANKKKRKVSIVGAYKSQGGQTICSQQNAYRISLNKMNKIVLLDLPKKEVTVQTGMTWAELQHYISTFGLSVKAMQSYNAFSIGGSLSVNAHGQDVKENPLIKTVKSFKIVTSNGDILNVSRTENEKLFSAAIGGYGLFGIIFEVTLELTDNVILERKSTTIYSKDLAQHFLKKINTDSTVAFYSARFSIGSNNLLEKAIVISYHKTNSFSKEYIPLKLATNYCFLRTAMTLLKKSDLIKKTRFALEKAYCNLSQIITRNKFMGSSLDCLPENKDNSYILQEYFIPYEHLNKFINFLRDTIKNYNINMLNVTARHVCKNTESMLTYSPQDCCALVLYLHIEKNSDSYKQIVEWTRTLINRALSLSGTYYLPYHLIGTTDQVKKSYPKFKDFIALKKMYDPNEMFMNKLYEKYTSYNVPIDSKL